MSTLSNEQVKQLAKVVRNSFQSVLDVVIESMCQGISDTYEEGDLLTF